MKFGGYEYADTYYDYEETAVDLLLAVDCLHFIVLIITGSRIFVRGLR